MIVMMMMTILMMMTIIGSIMIVTRTSIIMTVIAQPSRPMPEFLASWPAAPAGGARLPQLTSGARVLAPRPRFWALRKREGGRLAAPARMT